MYTMTLIVKEGNCLAIQVYENTQRCVLTQIANDLKYALPLHISVIFSITETKL